MATTAATPFPEQFEDFTTFREWLLATFGDPESATDKGAAFRDFAIDLLPMTAAGRRFGRLRPSDKESHDQGVDAVSAEESLEPLAVQTKLTLREKADIDQIISKFEAYEATLNLEDELKLIPDEGKTAVRPVFAIVCGAPLSGIIAKYEASQMSSRGFYDKLRSEQRLLIWDGHDLLREVRQILTRLFQIPPRISVTSPSGWIASGNVYLGVVRGRDIAELERDYGPGLFFENVRGFKGLEPFSDRQTVNEAIQATAREAPDRMLARNNGITIRASQIDQRENTLVLDRASIVNGRQTSGCLLSLGQELSGSCEIPVKVVQAESDAWDIAEAANNQNTVAQIDLKLARYFRVQLAGREVALQPSDFFGPGSHKRFADIIAGVREDEDTFDQLRYLFIGLFCNRPNQLWQDNYSRLKFDVLDAVFEGGEPPASLYPTLYRIATATNDALVLCEGLGDDDPLARLHEENRPKYRAYLALLTLCATHDIDLSDQLDTREEDVARLNDFLTKSADVLDGNKGVATFNANFMAAYLVAAEHILRAQEDDGDTSRVQSRMAGRLAGHSFSGLLRQVRLQIKMDRRRREVTDAEP